jgi:hypothetical protein
MDPKNVKNLKSEIGNLEHSKVQMEILNCGTSKKPTIKSEDGELIYLFSKCLT